MPAEDLFSAILSIPQIARQLSDGEVTVGELYRRALGGERAAETVLRAAASCGDAEASEMVEALGVARSGSKRGDA